MKSKMRDGLRRNRRVRYAVIFIIAALVCAGYIFYVPKLINADKPFIELSGEVGDAIGSAKSAAMSGNRDDERQDSTVTPSPVPKRPDSTGEYVTIRVADETITVNGIKVTSFEDFEARVNGNAFSGKNFELIDDYAELKTFRRAMRILNDCERPYVVRTEE